MQNFSGLSGLGYYTIGAGSKVNYPLRIDCAMEAKCYAENHSVGVKEMSRLILRIRHRQFGVLVTTSFVHEQVYGEVLEDGHPILIVSATDIARVLRINGITLTQIDEWFIGLDESYDHNFQRRMLDYSDRINNK